ncbi:MAG: hypothetical protein KDA53_15775 [Hyphomonas sp.]|nr:hypothetical protein [Hyphomonas sp.]
MEPVDYSRRMSIQEKGDMLWRAFPDRLEYYAPDGALRGVVPYDKVKSVRLAFAPGRTQRSRFLMQLSGARSQVTVSNMHFKGFGNFEDRWDTFEPLVRAVVAGVNKANPAAQFRAGEKPALYYLMLAFVAASFGLLGTVILALPLVPGNVTLSVVVKAAIILFSLPLLFSWLVNARPRRFDPVDGLDAVLAAR